MKKSTIFFLFLVIISCSNRTKESRSIENQSFTKNIQLLDIVNKEIERNYEGKIIMLIFINRNDTNYIISKKTSNLPVPILKKGDNTQDKFNSFSLPYCKFKNHYVIFYSDHADAIMNSFVTMNSLKHKPNEFNDLRQEIEIERYKKYKQQPYRIYYVTHKDSIAYLGEQFFFTGE